MFCLKIHVGLYEFLWVIKKVVTFFVTKNVFSFDNVCKIKSLWQRPHIWSDNVTWCDARLQFNIHANVLIRPQARVWDISRVPRDSWHNQFGSWHIWHNYVTNLTNSDWSHSLAHITTKMLGPRVFVSCVSISISVPFTPHLPHFEEVDLRLYCECQKNTKTAIIPLDLDLV